jgi:hypothetical protein
MEFIVPSRALLVTLGKEAELCVDEKEGEARGGMQFNWKARSRIVSRGAPAAAGAAGAAAAGGTPILSDIGRGISFRVRFGSGDDFGLGSTPRYGEGGTPAYGEPCAMPTPPMNGETPLGRGEASRFLDRCRLAISSLYSDAE